MGVTIFLKGFLEIYSLGSGKKKIKIADIGPGMTFSKNFFSKFKKELEEEENFGVVSENGLDEQQAGLLKKWCANKNMEFVKIMKKNSFAAYMFAGAIFTLLAKISIINLIMEIFKIG